MGSTTRVKIDSRWIGLHGPNSRIWWIQNELSATTAIRDTQTQPSVRWGKVPFGADNCTTPSRKAVMAAKAWRGIAGAASSSGARVMTRVPGFGLGAPQLRQPREESPVDVNITHIELIGFTSRPRQRRAHPPRTARTPETNGFASPRSERNVVVHVAVAGAGRYRAAWRGGGRAAGAEIAAGIIPCEIAAPAAAAAIEHGQVRVEPLQHHLGRVLLDAGLVGPFARLQLALDVNLGALLEILLGDLAEPFIEDDHAVPLGLFLALAGGLVAPAFGGRDAQIGNWPPILGAPDFRILAEISD